MALTLESLKKLHEMVGTAQHPNEVQHVISHAEYVYLLRLATAGVQPEAQAAKYRACVEALRAANKLAEQIKIECDFVLRNRILFNNNEVDPLAVNGKACEIIAISDAALAGLEG